MFLQIIADESEFLDLRPAWNHILDSSRQNSPFLEFDWLWTWWRTHSPKGILHVVAARGDNGELLGALPVFSATVGRYASMKAGRLLGDQGVGSTALGPFAAPDHEEEFFGRLRDYLTQGRPPWDVVDFDFLDVTSPFYELLASERKSRATSPSGMCPLVELPEHWDSFLEALPKKRAKDLGRCIRRASDAGAEVERIDDMDALDLAVDDLMALNERRLRDAGKEDYVTPPSLRDFTRLSAKRYLAEDRLSMLFLRVDGERVAGTYQFKFGDAMVAQICGFKEPPGLRNVLRPLIAHTLQDAIDKGCSVFDMHLGDQKYKFEWGVSAVREYGRVQLYNSTPQGLIRQVRDKLPQSPRTPAPNG